MLDDAEDIVIRSAFKALAQKYHPDKWTGDKTYATERMSQINQAYLVLSDKVKREQYDSELKDLGRYKDDLNQPDDDQLIPDDEESWKLACEFMPHLATLASELRFLRSALENQFKAYLIETRYYDTAETVATALRQSYLETYFGSNDQIQKFAYMLLKDGRKKDALVLNQVVSTMGQSISAAKIVQYVLSKSNAVSKNSNRARQLAKLIASTKSPLWELCIELLQEVGIEVKERYNANYFDIELSDKTRNLREDQFVRWTKNNVAIPLHETGYFDVSDKL